MNRSKELNCAAVLSIIIFGPPACLLAYIFQPPPSLALLFGVLVGVSGYEFSLFIVTEFNNHKLINKKPECSCGGNLEPLDVASSFTVESEVIGLMKVIPCRCVDCRSITLINQRIP